MWRGLIDTYRDRLPVTAATPVVTLHEGNTPLLPAPLLSARTGCDVYLKVEGANPTGSFKDRGMTVAVSKAVEDGNKVIICASTGNTSASAAAYAEPVWSVRYWCRRARSPWASSLRRWCTVPGCFRSAATSTTACRWPPSSPRTTRSPW